MSPEAKIALAGAIVVGLTTLVVVIKFVVRRAPLKPKRKQYTKQWRALQKYCADKQTWPEALAAADALLDKALVRKGVKGKSTGERLVNAQKLISDNDSVWFSHKLYKKTIENPALVLKEKDVKDALVGFREALKDLKAL